MSISVGKVKIIYSINKHKEWGYIVEPLIVEMMKANKLSLKTKKLYKSTLNDYLDIIEDEDLNLIHETLDIEESAIITKFMGKSISPKEFFEKHYKDNVHRYVMAFLTDKLNKIFHLINDRDIYFEYGKTISTAKIKINPVNLNVVFNFNRAEDGLLKYFPTIYENDKIVNLSLHKDSIIITNKPLRIIINNILYCFSSYVESNKILPFFKKEFIEIPLQTEKEYLEKFVKKLVSQYDVQSNDIEIKEHKASPKLIFQIEDIFGKEKIKISFKYDTAIFNYNSSQNVITHLFKQNDKFYFVKHIRDKVKEQVYIKQLIDMGLVLNNNNDFFEVETDDFNNEYGLHDWISSNINELEQIEGIEIINNVNDIVYRDSSLQIKLNDKKDWFEIDVFIQIGKQTIPFVSFVNNIRNNDRQFKLIDGKIFIIPIEWFSKLKDITDNFDERNLTVRLKKANFKQIENLNEYLEGKEIKGYKKSLKEFLDVKTENIDLPDSFVGTLRGYQQEGFSWLCKLDRFKFGGCLADDMGLGKTVQILAFLNKLQASKTNNSNQLKIFEEPETSLVIMPASLIHNWCAEAIKFTPNLSYLVHYGNNRTTNANIFSNHDVIFTTYGTARSDSQMLSKFLFKYIILDESQAIKNPHSLTYRALRDLEAQNRLVINGTPIENSLSDLWSQMNFVNPGILGSFNKFKKDYIQSIEKKKSNEKIKSLQDIVSPFILRRLKKEVEKELPDKIEILYTSEMTTEQSHIYEKIKSAFRNEILNSISTEGLAKSSMSILTGLLRLRQIANHPYIYDKEYNAESGKFNDVIRILHEIIPNHKVLIFSQFVNHLAIYQDYLNNAGISYSYLDGSTTNREAVINKFKTGDNKIFLLSLKSGGYGLNLTEADYVFLLDPWWNPQVENQAMDRAHCIGQEKKVFVYKFITKNTVEEKIVKLQASKKKLSDSIIVTENTKLNEFTEDDIKYIFG